MSKGRRIIDEFTDRTYDGKKVSGQRRQQLRWRKASRCIACGQPAAPSGRKGQDFSARCAKHLAVQREYLRDYNEAQRRNLGAHSYRMENADGMLSG